MNVGEVVGRVLADLGVGHAFGVVGSGNFVVTNALRANGVPFLATRHEGGAATMADAYSRMSGRLGVVTVHQGCGLTNALTGIGEAAKSRTPMLVLAADTPAAAVRSNFRIDQNAAVTAVGAVAERVYGADSAVGDVLRAYRTAVDERRTVVLNMALDVQACQSPEPARQSVPVPAPVRPHPRAVDDLVEVFRTARRPVFIAGRGARSAAADLARLADTMGALLATSAVAHGLFHDSPWSLGISGGFASPLAAELISGADLVVGWGCVLNQWTTRHGRLLGADAKLVQVDVDSAALGAHRPIELGVVGDVGRTARDVLARLTPRPGYWTRSLGGPVADRARWRHVPYEDLSTATAIDPRTLTARLDDLLPAQRVVSVDGGNFMGYPSAYLSVPDEFGFCFPHAFQSIGLGLASAVGAALARPDRLSVAALGDGGFLMSIADLETIARIGLPMVIVVYNDDAYGAEVHHFAGPEVDLGTVRFPDTDLAAIARGFGCDGVTVRTEGDLKGVADWLAGDRDRPLVVDAKIANDGGSWWLAEAFRGH